MLVRVTEVEPTGKGQGATGKGQSAKGRATPKRSEAQKRRRQPVPTNRKEAAKLRRERTREQRGLQRQALLTGDERNLPVRDAGPAKRLARDVVDSRFTLGQIFFAMILLVLVFSFVVNPRKYPTVTAAVNLLALVSVAAVFADSIFVGRRAKKMVVTAYDEKSAIGITVYAAIRAMQPRRFRRPPPKVKRGQELGK